MKSRVKSGLIPIKKWKALELELERRERTVDGYSLSVLGGD